MTTETLTGHTLEDHGAGGPVRHAWRAGWSIPNRDLERAGKPARTIVPMNVADGPPGDGTTGADLVALALCGVALPHRVAQAFDPADPQACAECAKELQAAAA